MEYLILIYASEHAGQPQPGTVEFDERMKAWHAFNEDLMARLSLVAGGSLTPSDTASTVEWRVGGASHERPGPAVDSDAPLGGFYLVESEDFDTLMDVARSVPQPVERVEVRQVAFRPDRW